jgi:hypothetical protein
MAVNATHPLASFPGASFDAVRRLMIWRPRGVLDDDLADQVIAFVSTQERLLDGPFNRFTDLSGLTQIRLQIGHVFDFAVQRRAAATELSPVKSAIYSGSIVGFGIAHLYASLMEGAAIEVRPFRTQAAAAEWLELPLESIAAFAEHDAPRNSS